jgi:hypothetical protein
MNPRLIVAISMAYSLKQLTLPRRSSSIAVMGDFVTYQEASLVRVRYKIHTFDVAMLNSMLNC